MTKTDERKPAWQTRAERRAIECQLVFSTHPHLTTSAVARLAERERREAELVHALRRVTFLASRQHYDEPSLSERCRLASLVTRCDEALRQLLAEKQEGRAA